MTGAVRRRLRSRQDGERGAVLVLVAITLSTLIGFASFAVDLGYQRVVRRDMQAVSDVVALDLARRIDGRTAQDLLSDAAFESAINASRDRNDFAAAPGRTITVELGVLDPLTNQLTSAMRTYRRVGTSNGVNTGPEPAGIPDAVRVTAEDTVDYFFRPGSGTTSRSAVTTIDAGGLASFMVGSFLLATNPSSDSAIGQVLNSVAPGASVLSYDGLARAQVTLGQLVVPLGVGSVGEVLSTQVSFRDLVLASITALTAQGGQTAAITVLNGLLTGASTVKNITIGDLFGADLSGGSPPASATVNVLSLLTSAVYLSDGQHFITIPGTTLNIPGVTQVTIDLTVIQPAQFGGFTVGAIASTGQFQLTVTPTFDFSPTGTTTDICTLPSLERNLINSLIGGVLNLLSCTLGSLNRVIDLNVNGSAPIAVTAAGATTTLTDIDCEAPAITLDPRSGAVHPLIGRQPHHRRIGGRLADRRPVQRLTGGQRQRHGQRRPPDVPPPDRVRRPPPGGRQPPRHRKPAQLHRHRRHRRQHRPAHPRRPGGDPRLQRRQRPAGQRGLAGDRARRPGPGPQPRGHRSHRPLPRLRSGRRPPRRLNRPRRRRTGAATVAAPARMVESADTMDSKSIARKGVRVQVPLRARR